MPQSSLTWWALWLIAGGCGTVVLIVLGLWLGGRLRRRVGDEPHCRKCNYVLVGNDSGRCPECGHHIDGDADVVKGHRATSPARWIAAVFVLLAGLGVLTWSSYEAMQKTPWYELAPLSYIETQLLTGDLRAGDELLRRQKAGDLNDDEVAELVDVILARQADPAGTWLPHMGLFIERLALAESPALGTEQWHRYLEQIDGIRMKFRDPMAAGYETMIQRTGAVGRRGNDGKFAVGEPEVGMMPYVLRWRIDGGPWTEFNSEDFYNHVPYDAGLTSSYGELFDIAKATADLAGQSVALDVDLYIFGGFNGRPATVHEWTESKQFTINVVPMEDLLPMTTSDESNTDAMLESLDGGWGSNGLLLKSRALQTPSGEGPGQTYNLELMMDTRPAGLAGRLELRAGSVDGPMLQSRDFVAVSSVNTGSFIQLTGNDAAAVEALENDLLFLVYVPDPVVLVKQSQSTDVIWIRPLAWPVILQRDGEAVNYQARLDSLGVKSMALPMPTTQPTTQPTLP